MRTKPSLRLSLLLLLGATPVLAQDPATPPQTQQSSPAGAELRQGPQEGRGRGVVGKITAIKDGALELVGMDGARVTVKLTDKTEYRKDRQSAKLADFKVGDTVFVRTEGSGDQGLTALAVAGRTGNGPAGPGMGGPGGGMMAMGGGQLGKDFVFGEVKSVDAPKITVLRPDDVTQTLELNEETSLRRGRESVTMADIQVGDHVFVRGGMQNNAFVPKMVMVIGPEQWKRMQEMGMSPGASKPPADSKPNPPER
jgi:preprotein translocase subunit YajC